MSQNTEAKKLIHTEQGQKWLKQFDPIDQDTAITLANSLTLISHSEFSQNLQELISATAMQISGKVALFAIRELEKIEPKDYWSNPIYTPYYEQVTISSDGQSVSSVEASSDLGSEAIVAHIIRQLCRLEPQKYLNHPTPENMRNNRCDAIIFIDDFIGSGGRVNDFLSSFWLERSITSWHSFKYIDFHVLAYSGTETGIRRVNRHKSRPNIHIHVDAPTVYGMFWPEKKKEKVLSLCEKYGHRSRKHMWLGYKQGMASIIFEHGCPNNTPAILWETRGWTGLFPNRTVNSSADSVFPSEIVRGDPIQILDHIGQKKLAKSGALSRSGQVGQVILTFLAMIAKGQRKRSSLCFALDISTKNYERILTKCIKWQFITPQKRITPKGLAELKAARKAKKIGGTIPLDRGSDYYYPRQLREATYD